MTIYEINRHADHVFADLHFSRKRANCSWSLRCGDVSITAAPTWDSVWLSFEQFDERYSQSVLILSHEGSHEAVSCAIQAHLGEHYPANLMSWDKLQSERVSGWPEHGHPVHEVS
jgi:hypothetical protein